MPVRVVDALRAARAARRAGAALSLCAFAAACALPDHQASTMVNPGKYSFYSCDQLVQQARVKIERERELRHAMEKAVRGPGGEVVVAVAYRSEYLTVKGEIEELERTAHQKNCRGSLHAVSDGVIR